MKRVLHIKALWGWQAISLPHHPYRHCLPLIFKQSVLTHVKNIIVDSQSVCAWGNPIDGPASITLYFCIVTFNTVVILILSTSAVCSLTLRKGIKEAFVFK